MGLSYQAVGWNHQKKRYDATLASLLGLYVAVFVALTIWRRPEITAETLALRALGTAALLLLHVILAIGPLCRLDRRFLPLLYNRRHLGVSMFLLAAAHGGLALFQFHALGDLDPLASVLASNARWTSLADFPFQPLGLVALVVLFLMAATSHDFWLANLTAPAWKALHMSVYLAYALLVGHVGLGVLQQETSPLLALPLALGLATLVALHVGAALAERRRDRAPASAASEAAEDGWVAVCAVDDIPEARARTFFLGGERVAVFRYAGRLSAISGVCQHQNGPLGEGKILDGCVTCPWHGYQYLPESGDAPAPFTEKLPTFRVRLEGRRVLVDPRPLPPGTRVEPAVFELASVAAIGDEVTSAPAAPAAVDPDGELFVGWQPRQPAGVARVVRRAVATLAALALVVACLLARGQSGLAQSFFEWDRARTFEGTLVATPVPTLWLARPGDRGAAAGRSGYPLVAPGKHGAAKLVAPLDGRRVHLAGKLIYRDGTTMLEVVPNSLAPVDSDRAATVPVARSLGPVALRGEIVDSKCFFGVMKPGEGKAHRDCAVRCISGGAPPALRIVDEQGAQDVILLVGAAGGSLSQQVLSFVAEPVEVAGELVAYDDLRVLRVGSEGIRRLGTAAERRAGDHG